MGDHQYFTRSAVWGDSDSRTRWFKFDAAKITGTLFGVSTAYLVVSALYVLTLIPFAVLLAYLLRVLTVMKRTLAIRPFILRETEQLEGVRNGESSEIQAEK